MRWPDTCVWQSCSERGGRRVGVQRWTLHWAVSRRVSTESALDQNKKSKFRGNPKDTLLYVTAFRAADFCFSIRVAAGAKGDAVSPHCRLFCGAEQHKIGGTEKEPTFAINPCALHTQNVLLLEHHPCWAVEISNVVLLPSLEWLRWSNLLTHWVVSYRVAPRVLECTF